MPIFKTNVKSGSVKIFLAGTTIHNPHFFLNETNSTVTSKTSFH